MSTIQILSSIATSDHSRSWSFYEIYKEFVSKGGSATHKTVKNKLRDLEKLGIITIRRNGRKAISYQAVIPESAKAKPIYVNKKGLGYKIWRAVALFSVGVCVFLQSCFNQIPIG